MEEADLDNFIREQKIKLANERKELNAQTYQPSYQSPAERHLDIHPGAPPQQKPQKKLVFEDDVESGLPLGEYENQKKRFQQERRSDTKNFVEKPRAKDLNPNEMGSLPLDDRSSAKMVQAYERNREYNEFLRQKEENPFRGTRSPAVDYGEFMPNKDPDRELQNRMKQERNREYNEFIRKKQADDARRKADKRAGPIAPQQPLPMEQPEIMVQNSAAPVPNLFSQPPKGSGYIVPYTDYEDMVRQKREEERQYRYLNGLPDSLSPSFPSKSPFSKAKEAWQNNVSNFGVPAYPQSYEAPRGTRIDPEFDRKMDVLDFDLHQRRARLRDDLSYDQRNTANATTLGDPNLQFLDPGPYMAGDMFMNNNLMNQFGQQREPQMPSVITTEPRSYPQERVQPTFAPPGGPPDPSSEKQRKLEYKRALEEQIRAQELAKKIEKEKELQIHFSGEKDPKNVPPEVLNGIAPRHIPQVNQVAPLQPNNYSGVIDRPLFSGDPGMPPTSFDPQYHYYAHADPLDPYAHAKPMQGLDMQQPQGSSQYQTELANQMLERQSRENRNRLDLDRLNRKEKEDGDGYFPFGKGGGGAPLRDADGNIIADLRELHHIVETHQQPLVDRRYHGQLTEVIDVHDDPAVRAPGDQAQYSGGFGDFSQSSKPGRPQESYKMQLKRQIEEKRRIDEERKRKEEEEDRKEEERIKRQMESMQREYEQEQEKIRQKREAKLQQEEEARREAEEMRKAKERAKQEEQERREEERRRQFEREMEERRRAQQQASARDDVKSPPIPAVQNKTPRQPAVQNTPRRVETVEPPKLSSSFRASIRRENIPLFGEKITNPESQSKVDEPLFGERILPPSVRDRIIAPNRYDELMEINRPTITPAEKVKSPKKESKKTQASPPAAQVREESRAEINRQLSAMRRQLQSEQRRIELQIEHKDKSSPLSKPKQTSPPPAVSKQKKKNSKRTDHIPTGPVRVRRNQPELETWKPIFKEEANEAALDTFMHSKYDPLTRSRDDFRQKFPTAPVTSDMLEVQQRDLIRQQERDLFGMRRGDNSLLDEDDLTFLVDHPNLSSIPLSSDSAYIGMNGETIVPTPPLIKKMEKMRDRRKLSNRRDSPPYDVNQEPKIRDLLPSPPSTTAENHLPRSESFPLISPQVLPFEPFQVDNSFARDGSPRQLNNPDALSLGSTFSFDVDTVARKNRERLRKLQTNSNDDDISVSDHDAILSKFMNTDAKPNGIRPMSTLSGDSDPDWLKPSL